jgi:hypothetical protein
MTDSSLFLKTGEYHQGWDAISRELAKKLLTLPHIRHSYPYIKYIRENAQSSEWVEAFADIDIYNQEKKKKVASVAMVNRVGLPQINTTDDEITIFERISTVQVQIFYGFPNFEKWNEIVDSAAALFAEGDRTLNKTCLSYSNPTANENDIASFGGIDSHYLYLSLTIEEIGEYSIRNGN